jgi:hypothetical protein
MLSEEALRVARRMAAGEVFYARLSPRLSPIIRDQLRAAGLEIQSESPRHESTFFYPLHKDKFIKQLEIIEKANDGNIPNIRTRQSSCLSSTCVVSPRRSKRSVQDKSEGKHNRHRTQRDIARVEILTQRKPSEGTAAMTNERKNITQPADWWVAFEEQAKAEGLTLAAWLGEAAKAKLPPKVARKLTERPPANRPPKAKD